MIKVSIDINNRNNKNHNYHNKTGFDLKNNSPSEMVLNRLFSYNLEEELKNNSIDKNQGGINIHNEFLDINPKHFNKEKYKKMKNNKLLKEFSKNENDININCNIKNSSTFRSISKELTKDFKRSIYKSYIFNNSYSSEKENLLKLNSRKIYNTFFMEKERKSNLSSTLKDNENDLNPKRISKVSVKTRNNKSQDLIYKSLNEQQIKTKKPELFKRAAKKRLKNPEVKKMLKTKIKKYKNLFNLIDRNKYGFISIKNIKLSVIDNEELELLSPILKELHKNNRKIDFKEFCIKIDRYLTNKVSIEDNL